MRLRFALFALTALGGSALALPASAQAYYGPYDQHCENVRKNNQAAGAVLGAVIGGVLGSNIAGHGHRGDGTAVGAGLGALTGAAAGSSTQCAPPPSAPYPVNAAPYPDAPPYDDGLAGAPGSHSGYYPPDDGVYDNRYGYGDSNRDYVRHHRRNNQVAARDTDTYKYQDDLAGRDCTTTTQVTNLPDGSSIQKPVQVCREARYGDWEVQN